MAKFLKSKAHRLNYILLFTKIEQDHLIYHWKEERISFTVEKSRNRLDKYKKSYE